MGMEVAAEPSRENNQEDNSSWDNDICQICLLGASEMKFLNPSLPCMLPR